ncbi:hypothetical protein GLOIN_2v1470777 [Rhizophagus irregularis DAOM 181602=DAOM 197198]|uniref:Uncharacterized protein n=1 Tax=Rhizophagus irregularis (strain DAOM 197198w) TaxID=1432141 RepID=A0A015JFX5_RHIIW|nr:hypothetical protein RirG_240210 [Rhizophagus irregularis DAOM 197198w]GBC40735.1 hypothetical protein GLOIN_2v1470777 [Rhizophagus irregularis DAOM 181602=DAOM 197198]
MTRHHRKKSFLSQTQYDIRGKVRAVTLYMVSMKEWCALQDLRPGGIRPVASKFFDIGQGEMINGNSSTTRTWHFSLNNPKNHKVIRKPRKNIKEATIQSPLVITNLFVPKTCYSELSFTEPIFL